MLEGADFSLITGPLTERKGRLVMGCLQNQQDQSIL
jgi:hypothetical protein